MISIVAGPRLIERKPGRTYNDPAWLVRIRSGDVLTDHHFKTEDEATTFASTHPRMQVVR